MKNLSLMITCAFVVTTNSALAQQATPISGAASEARPEHQIALIDMAYIFKSYDKFTAMTAALQKDIEQTDQQAKGMVENLQNLQAQLTSGELEEGSPDYTKLEEQLLKSQSDLESFRRVAQRDFFKKEADLYKTVYLEVEDLVQKYANYHGYTLVLRFERDDVDAADNPRDIISGMNRQVVYYRSQDDITDAILTYLNKRWNDQQTASGSSGGTTRPN